MIEIATSILALEKENEEKVFYELETSGTNYIHIDVMDGKFVEKNTEDRMYEYTSIFKRNSNLLLDVHLMVEDVKDYIEKYISFEPSIITIHYESCKSDEEVFELLKYIKENNIKVGLAISPSTKVEKIKKFLSHIYLFLVMTVEPGKGGQKLIPSTLAKIKEAKQYIYENNLDTYIQVDGGINPDTADLVKSAGAEILVVGSAITSAENIKQVITDLKKL